MRRARLVVVDDFDFIGMIVSPFKTDAPLVVDADTILTASVAAQSLKPIARRVCQISEGHGPVKGADLAKDDTLDRSELPAVKPAEYLLCVSVPKGANHTFILSRSTRRVQRHSLSRREHAVG